MAHNYEAGANATCVGEDRTHNFTIDEATLLARAARVPPPAQLAPIERRVRCPAFAGTGGTPRPHQRTPGADVAAVARRADVGAEKSGVGGGVLAQAGGRDRPIRRP
jgi:hypothetical protein